MLHEENAVLLNNISLLSSEKSSLEIDIHTLTPTDAHELSVNDIGLVQVQVQQALPLQPYEANRVGGALIIVDPTTHRTSGALLVKALGAGAGAGEGEGA